ncbi:MAG: hypothetical protein JNM27_03475 [Leptospirales bacterium]|nr:hypothetical protein [Leptospirales bacterium]
MTKIQARNTIGFILILLVTEGAADMGRYAWLELKEISAKASATLLEEGKPEGFYGPMRAADRDPRTAWCVHDGPGESIEFTFSRTPAKSIFVLGGVMVSKDLYYANNRVKDYELAITTTTGREIVHKGRLKDGACRAGLHIGEDPCFVSSYDGNMEDTEIALNASLCIKKVRFRIVSIYPGSRYNDTCISEVFVGGDRRWGDTLGYPGCK